MQKIEYAVGAAGVFAAHLHQEGFDRGMIATFGNNFRIAQSFTSTESYIHYALRGLVDQVNRDVRNNQGQRTRLYDSIEDVITEFWRNGERDRPWLLTVITDGQDNESSKYRNDPAGIGRYIGQRFNHEPSNFVFVIGVGEGSQIDRSALGTMGNSGNFLAMTIAAFPLLELAFLQIAVNVSSALVGQRIQVGNLSWEEVARIRQVSRIPLDYAFLLDCSGSMSEPG